MACVLACLMERIHFAREQQHEELIFIMTKPRVPSPPSANPIRYSSLVISDEFVQQVLPDAGIAVAGDLDNIAPFRIGTLFVVDGILHQITNRNVATNMVELQRCNDDDDNHIILMPECWVETSLNAANE